MNTQFPDQNLIQQAEELIVQFERSRLPGIWPGLDKQQIIDQMRSRISNPFSLNQGGQPFCGPASVVFDLIRKNPLRYVQICQSLFHIGGFNCKTKWINASDRLRQSTGELQMPQLDWMVLATLRDAENILFPVEPDAPEAIRNITGMTKPWEVKGWVREILGYRHVKYTRAYLSGDINAMRHSAEVIDAGGVAIALVTADGMLTKNPPPVPFPSHWITLVGNISMQNKTISFDVYTWARKMQINIEEGLFKNYFWGVVTGLP